MLSLSVLKQKLAAIDGQDYAAYQSLLGTYDFDLFKLIIQQIPKDPYAPPHTGIYRIQLKRDDHRVINLEIESKIQRIASADFLARYFFKACQKFSKGIRGTGFGGLITINEPGQAILERNSVIIADDMIEIRCFLGLPANGRLIQSEIAEEMIYNELPKIVENSVLDKNADYYGLNHHINVTEDA
ncbi:MAG: ABC-ATPase domain-containing protein, partial [Calditrichaceae bacterium]